jgi:hypothetical protein
MRFCISLCGTASNFRTPESKFRNSLEGRDFAMRVSSVTLSIAATLVFASYLHAQKRPSTPNPAEQPPGNTQPAVPAIPPINVTVAAPQKSAEEAQAEARDREREIAIQEEISSYTGLLLLVGVAQVVAAIAAVVAAFKAASSARRSAEVADDQRQILTKQQQTIDEQAGYMREGLAHTKLAADAAKQSADIAALALEQADRPWVRVHIEPKSLEWSETEGVEITAIITVENIGRSVAEHVTIWNDYVPDSGREAEQRQKELSDDVAKFTMMGMTLFPGDRKAQQHTVGTRRDRTDRYWRAMMPDMLDRELGQRIISAKYIGCVGYRYGTSKNWHYTFWGFDVVSKDGRQLVMQMATGIDTGTPHLSEPFIGNLNRAN